MDANRYQGSAEAAGGFGANMIHETAFIHPKAETDDSVSIGEGARIWQFATVIRGARIGKNCSIASGACVDGSFIGDRTVIAHNLAMGPGFKVGNDCFIAPNVTFCNDAWPRAHKQGFDVSAYADGRYAVIVEDGASVGAGAVILPGVRIGAGAMVGAGAVVTRDVPAGMLYLKNGDMSEIMDEGSKRRVRFARQSMPEVIEPMFISMQPVE